MKSTLKTILTLVLAVMMLASFVSCGGNPSIVLPDESEDENKTDIFAFEYNGVKIHVNDVMESTVSSDTVKSKFGAPLSYEESNSCAYQGLDKVYRYPGFTVYSYPDNNVDYVLMIVFSDDTVKTPAGIGIGSKAEDVIGAYGGTWDGDDCNLNYSEGSTSLTFAIIGGEVKALQYCYTEG